MTAHECDDTAYPAAAMPDECTCGGSPMTDPTCAERIADQMAGRAETIGKLYAAFEECEYVLDGRDTDDNFGADPGGTPWYRCTTHDDTAMGYTSDGEPHEPDFPCNGYGSDEDGLGIGSEDEIEERLAEMPLSVEVIRHIKILLSTGGPADWLDAELDADNEIRVLEYHYADWGTHASVYVEKHSPLWRFAESFVELAAVEA
jgi:hypothetical protein